MKSMKLAISMAVLALLAVSGQAWAQGSTSVLNETTTAEVAAKLSTSTTQQVDLSKNGIDTTTTTTPDPTRNADGTDIKAFTVENSGDPLHLINCNGNDNNIETYNSNDKVWWVPYQKLSVPNLGKGEPRCATSTCWLKVNGVWSDAAVGGYVVVIGGRIRGTNPTSYARGCAAYIPNFKG